MNEDRIFASEGAGDGIFRFDEAVAAVFPDMLQRSIPGYAASIAAIGSLARRYVQAKTHCYDLGCSLGEATLSMRHSISVPDCRIFAIDNAASIESASIIVKPDIAVVPPVPTVPSEFIVFVFLSGLAGLIAESPNEDNQSTFSAQRIHKRHGWRLWMEII